MEILAMIACAVAGVSAYFGYFGVLYGLTLLIMVALSCLTGSLARKSCDLNQLVRLTCIPLFIIPVTTKSTECSQSQSQIARSLINRSVHPQYHIFDTNMPSSCPLHSDNDQFDKLEKLKRHLGTTGHLVCSVCGKTFSKDDDIDAHIRQFHESMVGYAQGCLADYCDILRCDVHAKEANAENFQCSPTQMAKIHEKCMTMVRDQCSFSDMEPSVRLKLESAIQASFCSYLTCDDYFLIIEDKLEDVYTRYYFTYAVLFVVLIVFIGLYFRVTTNSLDESLTWEEFIKAEKESIAREPIGRLPPSSPEMTIRQRTRDPMGTSESY